MKARPFLKWAGGKAKLALELLKRVPSSYGVYREPFLGGGALFFALAPRRAVLSDINPSLYVTYRAVQAEVESVIAFLKALEKGHVKWGPDHYLQIRALDEAKVSDGAALAARMIYLNKTCFNGLWRVNKKGKFNVPMGKFASLPTICDEVNLRACSIALQGADIVLGDFRETLNRARKNDFVYLDPPYVPMSNTANFTAYTKEGFGMSDQQDLAVLTNFAVDKGVHVLLSNAGNSTVTNLYPKTRFKIEEVGMKRNINCVGEGRGSVVEYLITEKRE